MPANVCAHRGSVEPAFTVELNANAIGPNVHLSTSKIEWGKALVLTDVTRSITLTNDSLVPAVYKCLLRKSDSPFTILGAEGTLAPQEVREFAVSAHMDDTVRSTNDLILQIVNAPEVVVRACSDGYWRDHHCVQGFQGRHRLWRELLVARHPRGIHI